MIKEGFFNLVHDFTERLEKNEILFVKHGKLAVMQRFKGNGSIKC